MPQPLSDGQQRLVFGALVVVLVVFGIYLSVGGFSSDDEQQQADRPGQGADGSDPQQLATAPPSPLPSTAAEDMKVLDWLPFTEAELKAAAATAQGFAAAYGTVDYSEPRQAYFKRMEDLATEEYAKTLSQSSGAGALWDEKAEKEITAEGHANVQSIRSFTDESVIFTVKTQSIIDGSDDADEDIGDFAVTVVKEGGGWQVYDFQPADAGNLGDV